MQGANGRSLTKAQGAELDALNAVATKLPAIACRFQTKSQTGEREPNAPSWQNVPYPNIHDTTRLAYDANSIVVTNDENGRVNGADVTARVIGGDVSILGKFMVLSFDCSNHYRINHSYPLLLDSPTQESYIGNVACGAIRCEMLRREGGRCSATP
jgi:hypothetical protein